MSARGHGATPLLDAVVARHTTGPLHVVRAHGDVYGRLPGGGPTYATPAKAQGLTRGNLPTAKRNPGRRNAAQAELNARYQASGPILPPRGRTPPSRAGSPTAMEAEYPPEVLAGGEETYAWKSGRGGYGATRYDHGAGYGGATQYDHRGGYGGATQYRGAGGYSQYHHRGEATGYAADGSSWGGGYEGGARTPSGGYSNYNVGSKSRGGYAATRRSGTARRY